MNPRFYSFLFVFIFACNKNNADDQSNQGYADSQVVGQWKITAFLSNASYDWDGDGSAETDIFNTWTDCEKDNRYEFDSDKTGTFQLSCSVTAGGAWQILNAQELTFIPGGLPQQMETIISLTSNQFQTTKVVTVSPGKIFTLTKTWTRM
jgi:hypothetical protein